MTLCKENRITHPKQNQTLDNGTVAAVEKEVANRKRRRIRKKTPDQRRYKCDHLSQTKFLVFGLRLHFFLSLSVFLYMCGYVCMLWSLPSFIACWSNAFLHSIFTFLLPSSFFLFSPFFWFFVLLSFVLTFSHNNFCWYSSFRFDFVTKKSKKNWRDVSRIFSDDNEIKCALVQPTISECTLVTFYFSTQKCDGVKVNAHTKVRSTPAMTQKTEAHLKLLQVHFEKAQIRIATVKATKKIVKKNSPNERS